ncbi:unnamed protein product, partial [Rangifer tarandus platyrhynchus]
MASLGAQTIMGDPALISGPGRSPGEGTGNPLHGLHQDTCRAPLALPIRSPPPWTQWCLSPAGCTGWRAMTRGPRAPTPTREGPSHLRGVVPQPHRQEARILGWVAVPSSRGSSQPR